MEAEHPQKQVTSETSASVDTASKLRAFADALLRREITKAHTGGKIGRYMITLENGRQVVEFY